jgi:hypothetical protein
MSNTPEIQLAYNRRQYYGSPLTNVKNWTFCINYIGILIKYMASRCDELHTEQLHSFVVLI